MKKLFTLKNCLIILFLLAVVAVLSSKISLNFAQAEQYKELMQYDGYESYSFKYKNEIFQIVTNFLMIASIVFFAIFFCLAIFKQIKFLKFTFITLLFICFVLSILQLIFLYLIIMGYRAGLDNTFPHPSYLAIGITALIALVISIACYVYLVVKELQKRKAAKQAEPQEAIVEPSSLEQLDPTTEQDTTQE